MPTNSKPIHTTVLRNGTASLIYDDRFRALQGHGSAKIDRVSHVEPHPTMIGWVADMGPIDGPVLGLDQPFELRQQALDAERAYLAVHLGL